MCDGSPPRRSSPPEVGMPCRTREPLRRRVRGSSAPDLTLRRVLVKSFVKDSRPGRAGRCRARLTTLTLSLFVADRIPRFNGATGVVLWLPGLVAWSVLRDSFRIRLGSLARTVRRAARRRTHLGRDALAADWQGQLASGEAQVRPRTSCGSLTRPSHPSARSLGARLQALR
jgi:hypothetical protein